MADPGIPSALIQALGAMSVAAITAGLVGRRRRKVKASPLDNPAVALVDELLRRATEAERQRDDCWRRLHRNGEPERPSTVGPMSS